MDIIEYIVKNTNNRWDQIQRSTLPKHEKHNKKYNCIHILHGHCSYKNNCLCQHQNGLRDISIRPTPETSAPYINRNINRNYDTEEAEQRQKLTTWRKTDHRGPRDRNKDITVSEKIQTTNSSQQEENHQQKTGNMRRSPTRSPTEV